MNCVAHDTKQRIQHFLLLDNMKAPEMRCPNFFRNKTYLARTAQKAFTPLSVASSFTTHQKQSQAKAIMSFPSWYKRKNGSKRELLNQTVFN